MFLTASRQDLGKFVVFKVGVMFTTLFLFFTTTTLVSFALRETQVMMDGEMGALVLWLRSRLWR